MIGALNGTLAQTEATAVKHNAKLGRAGLQQAHPAQTNSYFNLYNVSYTRGPNLEVLKNLYSQIYATLPEPAKDNLYIEKIDSQNFMIVYRCWQSKASALKIARQHGTLLGKKKFSPAVLSADIRLVVYSKSDRPGKTSFPSSWQIPRTDASSPTSQDIAKIRRAVRKIGLHEERIDNKETGREQSTLISPGTAGLTKKMDVFLQEQKTKGTLRQQERTAWLAYDLTNDTYLVSINSQRLFQAASMIKPFVALAFFQQVDKGNLSYNPKSRQMMEEMIQKSNNQATNWFIRQLGGPTRCEALLKKEYGHLFKQVKIKEYIPAGGRTYLNSALPSDYIQFLKALWNEQLPYSKEMLRLMALPGRDRIFYGTEVPNGTLVYNKTGTTAHLCGDMGILVPQTKDGRKVPYAIVGIVERSSTPADYKQWMVSSGGAIRNFSTFVYEEMKRKHDLP
ncbi:MAG: serine hydrolase [Desulfobulbaceae bacterium]|nr:serine hydrolase [Desulfobulbaceae bacterium]